MGEQVTFGDFILGLEGLAILRAWMADSEIVVTRRRKVQELAGRLAEEPWSNPIFAEEKEIATFGFADQMPDLVEAAVEGLPIVVVWELERNG